jgi:hypothetical protein
MKDCTGSAKILAGVPDLIGQPGGFGGRTVGDIPVPPNSAAVFVSQFGGDKPALRNVMNQISGTVQLPDGPVSFQSVGDTIGSLSRSGLRNLARWRRANTLVLELNSLSVDPGGVFPVKISVPINFPCPTGTNATGVVH